MKEITRRLYTKPVMLGVLLLVGMVVVLGLFVTTKTRAMSTFIPAGDDLFETTGNGETYHNFAASPIPAGFFTSNGGSPSQAYNDLVPLVGKPLSAGSDIDTIIHRNEDVTTPGTTTLTMTGLSLESINPITITYSDGSSEAWSVHVGLSAFKSSTGSMSIGDGGTFDSSLKVWPKFTFTSLSDGEVKVLDTGGSGSGLTAQSDSGGSGFAVAQSASVSDGSETEPVPAPTVAPAPCRAVAIDDAEVVEGATVSAASTASCPPVTLTSSNSPWAICNGHFCIPRPITEAELLASHNASPPGTKKKIAVQQAAIR